MTPETIALIGFWWFVIVAGALLAVGLALETARPRPVRRKRWTGTYSRATRPGRPAR